jgi:Holliday junction resolvase-like predicted endonuclease
VDAEQYIGDSTLNSTDKGKALENILITFLRAHLPRWFDVDSGYIMNDSGKMSLQQDVVIYDPMGYVLLKNTDDGKVFPAESVYAAIEVKTRLGKTDFLDCSKKAKSVKMLSGIRLYAEKPKSREQPRCKVDRIEPFGGTCFCCGFAFKGTKGIKDHGKDLVTNDEYMDSLYILDTGALVFYSKGKMSDEDHYRATTTTNRREAIGILGGYGNKLSTESYVLLMLLDQLMDHFRYAYHKRAPFHLSNYIHLFEGAYSNCWGSIDDIRKEVNNSAKSKGK